jgi:hypothetical protein
MDYRTRANLRDLLARLYYRDPDIERIIDTVGLNPSTIAWDSRPVNTWQSVLQEAEFHGKLLDVIGLARQEKPNVQSLALAEQDILLTVETPLLQDAAWHGPTAMGDVEKVIGTLSTLRPIGFLLRGFEVSKPVCRVVLADGSCGSGFLINGNLLLTNHHVLPTKEVARHARVEFNYQKSPAGLNEPTDPYPLSPDSVFATSPREEQGGDDWTAVQVQGDPSTRWGTLPLIPLPAGTPQKLDEVIIIQHPGGGQKQIALSHNIVAFADMRRLQYLTDTLDGSSGSPVFDVNWHVVALHHKGGVVVETPGTKQAFSRNQGIHINVVIDGLAKHGLL